MLSQTSHNLTRKETEEDLLHGKLVHNKKQHTDWFLGPKVFCKFSAGPLSWMTHHFSRSQTEKPSFLFSGNLYADNFD